MNPKSIFYDEAAEMDPKMLDWFAKEQERLRKEEFKLKEEKLRQLMEHGHAVSISTPPSRYEKLQRRSSKMSRVYSDVSIEQLTRESARTISAIEVLKQAKFRKGDVAYHKDYGNCLVQAISLIDLNATSGLAHNPEDAPNFSIVYEIITVSTPATSGGPAEVKEEELVVYNDMTKALFDKGR